MRIEVIEIKPGLSYSFIVGAGERPDSRLREELRGRIAAAMGALGKEPDSYNVSFLRIDSEPGSDWAIPQLEPDRDYLIIASLSVSDPAHLSEEELDEQRRDLERGIILPEGSRGALVLLHNAIVRAIIGRDGRGAESAIIPPLDPLATIGDWK